MLLNAQYSATCPFQASPVNRLRAFRRAHRIDNRARASSEGSPVISRNPTQANGRTDVQIDLARREVFIASIGVGVTALSGIWTDPVLAASISKVFVAGASGNTGRRVIRELQKRGIAVRAGVRDVDAARAKGLQLDDKVELVTADVTKPETLAAAIGDAQAVISAIGFKGGADAKGYEAIDNKGNVNLVDAAVAKKVGKFVLLSSLLTNGAAVGQRFNPGYIFLNLFGNVLNQKLVSEKYLRSSGLEWTIVRPGGLKNDPPSDVGNLIVGKEDTLFGRPSDPGKDISRDLVAEVMVEALLQSGASNKVVEIVSSKKAEPLPASRWFKGL